MSSSVTDWLHYFSLICWCCGLLLQLYSRVVTTQPKLGESLGLSRLKCLSPISFILVKGAFNN